MAASSPLGSITSTLPSMNAQVRNNARRAFSRARSGDGDEVFFRGNADGPEHAADDQLGAPEEDIAVMEFIRKDAQQTGKTARGVLPEFRFPFPPVADPGDYFQEIRAHFIGAGTERIPPPDELPEPGQQVIQKNRKIARRTTQAISAIRTEPIFGWTSPAIQCHTGPSTNRPGSVIAQSMKTTRPPRTGHSARSIGLHHSRHAIEDQ